VIFITVRLLWATVRTWYMPSCPVHVSVLLPVLMHFWTKLMEMEKPATIHTLLQLPRNLACLEIPRWFFCAVNFSCLQL